jgi:DNA repair ATPase RecN
MLSAAYDAYEKVKMELVAATETIKELTDELTAKTEAFEGSEQRIKDLEDFIKKNEKDKTDGDKTSIDPADIP